MIARMKASGVCCSFCGKAREEVTDIMAGAPHATKPRRPPGKSSFICNEYVSRFNQLLASTEINTILVPTANR
jgi:ClpX C4-type zinc finger